MVKNFTTMFIEKAVFIIDLPELSILAFFLHYHKSQMELFSSPQQNEFCDWKISLRKKYSTVNERNVFFIFLQE